MSEPAMTIPVTADAANATEDPAEEMRRISESGVAAAGMTVELVDGPAWDAIAAEFDDAVHEQTACFTASRWGADHIETIVFRLGGEIVGGAAVIVRPVRILRTGLAIVKWGPLWRRRSEEPDVSRLRMMLDALRQEYACRRGLFLTVMPHADPGHSDRQVELLRELGFKAGARLAAPERYLVNTALEQDELRRSLSQKWRYNLKKSEKNTFEIEFADVEYGMREFSRLYETMLARKKFQDSSAYNTLPDLMAARDGTFSPRIVLVSYDGTVTAGAVLDLSGERAVYLYGATDDRALRTRAGYAMHWWIAARLCEIPQVLWYDLGGNDLDTGLHQFKSGFVGKAGAICMTPRDYHYGATVKAWMFGILVFGARKTKAVSSRIFHALRKRAAA